jgi:nitrite transporter NirC
VPISVPEAIDDHDGLAATKARRARDLPRYLFLSALAGAYVGVAVVLMVSVSAPLVTAGSGFAKLTQGAVFGVALTLVVFAGAELFTGNAMFMLQGWWQRTVRPVDVALVGAASLARNLLWTVPGNVVGGGLVIGLGYAWVARWRPAVASTSGHLEGAEVAPAGNGADGGAQRTELGPEPADGRFGRVGVDTLVDQG